MINQQTAALEFQLLTKTDQLFALPGNVSRLFLRFGRHSNDGQLSRVSIQIARQPLTQCGGIARISLYPSILLIEFARRDYVAMRPDSFQLSIEIEAKAACFVNHMHHMTRS